MADESPNFTSWSRSGRVLPYLAGLLAVLGLSSYVLGRSGWPVIAGQIGFSLSLLMLGIAAILQIGTRNTRTRSPEATDRGAAPTVNARSGDRDTRGTKNLVLSFSGVGILAIVLYASTQTTSRLFWSLVGTLVLESGACFAIGSLAGFLFGIPRSLQGKSRPIKEPDSPGAKVEPASQQSSHQEATYGSNTNLEEISDWLTKIIVGLGLINLSKMIPYLKGSALYLANLSGVRIPESLAFSLIIYFSVCGFFLAYLLTRLFLPAAFSRAERAALEDISKAVSSVASRVEDSSRKADDAKQMAAMVLDIVKAKDLIAKIRTAKEEDRDLHATYAAEFKTKLEGYSQRTPTYRILHIVLANLYEALGQWQSAVKVLERFLRSKEGVGEVNDGDAASAWFNLACYYSTQYSTTNDSASKQTFRKAALENLEKSLTVAKAADPGVLQLHITQAEVDEDLEDLRKEGAVEEILCRFRA